MVETTHVPSLEDAKKYIDAINFSMVIDKIVKTKRWKRKDVLKICELYKHFLFLKKKYDQNDEKLSPSLEIDEFWHNHIMDTKKYRNDCDQIFGFYLDHYPYIGMDGKTTQADAARSFERTQELHHKEFGDYIYTVRNVTFSMVINLAKSLILSSKPGR